jgi:hypothetical protein
VLCVICVLSVGAVLYCTALLCRTARYSNLVVQYSDLAVRYSVDVRGQCGVCMAQGCSGCMLVVPCVVCFENSNHGAM